MRSSAILAIVAASCLTACQQGGPVAANPGADGWQNTFSVDKANLGPSGSNPYLSLQPGSKKTYKEGGTVLVITVLDETLVIDGVTTRIIEERETSGGELKEVSRNYFACDRASGDMYYFGEDVNIYKGGKVVEHEGAWRSGVNGAHFGMMLPAKPAVGQKFYQELAPKVAMDRIEIVGVDETLKTPAGTFAHCVHVKETSPLERGSGEKWFAPGVGLVKDDETALVSAEK